MLRRHRLLSIRPRRCSGRSNLAGFLYLSFLRRWRSRRCCLLRLRLVTSRGPPYPSRSPRAPGVASVLRSLALSFVLSWLGLLRLLAGTSTEESSRACKSPIHHIHETTHANCSGVARRIDCRAQPGVTLSHFSAMTRPSWLGRAVRNPPRHRAGAASMAWRRTRRFSANAP